MDSGSSHSDSDGDSNKKMVRVTVIIKVLVVQGAFNIGEHHTGVVVYKGHKSPQQGGGDCCEQRA